jgi:hypothetical protein
MRSGPSWNSDWDRANDEARGGPIGRMLAKVASLMPWALSAKAEARRLRAERDRLLWLACKLVNAVSLVSWEPGREIEEEHLARRILGEHGYTMERIQDTIELPEPVVPQ